MKKSRFEIVLAIALLIIDNKFVSEIVLGKYVNHESITRSYSFISIKLYRKVTPSACR